MTRALAFLFTLLAAAPSLAAGAWNARPLAGQCSTFSFTGSDQADAQPAVEIPAGELSFTSFATNGTAFSVAFYEVFAESANPAAAIGARLVHTATGNASLPVRVTTNGGTLDVDIDTDGDGGWVKVCAAGYRNAGASGGGLHAATHAENAADEVLVENLGTACADGEIPQASSGGIVCAAPSAPGAHALGGASHTADTWANVAARVSDTIPFAGSATEGGDATAARALGQASAADGEYPNDATANCNYYETDGDGVKEDGEHCIARNEVWTSEFLSGSSTFGIQEAVTSVCTAVASDAAAVVGGVVNIPSGIFDLTTNYITVPSQCRGIIIRGQGVGQRFGASASNTGTLLKFNLTASGDAFTFTGPNSHWRVEDLNIQFVNQGAGSTVFSIPANNDHWVIQNVYTVAQSAPTTTGVVADVTDSQSFTVGPDNRFEGMGVAISVAGTEGNGGGRIIGNTLRSAGGTSGGTNILVSGNYPCVDLEVSGNRIETANRGIDFSAATTHCHANIVRNYFEPSNDSATYEDIRASGFTSVSAAFNLFNPSGADAFHRTTQSSGADAIDTFYGNEHRGPITMDAGTCHIYGVAKGSGDVSACGRATVANRAETITGAWDASGGRFEPPTGTAFPGSPATNEIFVVTDDSAIGACDSAAGSARSLCHWNGSAWQSLGDGGGGGSGDVTDVGDCATGACFTGATGTALRSNTDLIMDLDEDNNGSESFQVRDGANAIVMEVSEAGVVTLPSTGSISIAANATAGQKMVLKEDSDGGASELSIDLAATNLTASVAHTPNASGLFTGATFLAPDTVTDALLATTENDCSVLYTPGSTIADTMDLTSVFEAFQALTITRVWCETDTGTATMDVQIDDGTPADVMGTDLTCDTTGEVDTTSLTGSMADGDRLDWAITSVASSPTRLTVCVEYTR